MNYPYESDEGKPLLKPEDNERRYSTTDSSTSINNNSNTASYGTISARLRVYKRRWYILFVFVAMNITQNTFWNTFGPIQGPVELIFHWKDRDILLITLWAAISFIVVSAPLGWLMEARGLRAAVLVASGFLVVGKTLQSLPYMGYTIDTVVMNMGQIIIVSAAPICLGAVTAVSAAWFPPSERTTATAIGAQSNYVGVAVGFLLGPAIVPDRPVPLIQNSTSNTSQSHMGNTALPPASWVIHVKARFKVYMYIELAVAVVVFIAILLYFPSKPKFPPSRSSSEARHNFQASLKSLLHNWLFLFIALLFSLQVAVLTGWLSIIDVILSKFGVDQGTAGWLGFSCTLAGIVSGVLISRFADYIQRSTKRLLLLMLILGAVSYVVFSLTCQNIIPMGHHTTRIVLYVSTIFGGFFTIGLVPLVFEIGVECTYPVSEGISTGFMMMLSNVFLLPFYIIFMFSKVDLQWVNWVACGSIVVCIPGMLMYRERYARLDVDTGIHDCTEDN